MKKVITLLLLMSICFADQVYAQTLCTIFNQKDSTCTSVFVEDGKFYIETKLVEEDESFGAICIGTNLTEAITVMENIKYFLTHPELEFVLIRIGDEYPKLYREPDGLDEDPTTTETPFITDGTEAYAQLPIQIVEELLRTLSGVR